MIKNNKKNESQTPTHRKKKKVNIILEAKNQQTIREKDERYYLT